MLTLSFLWALLLLPLPILIYHFVRPVTKATGSVVVPFYHQAHTLDSVTESLQPQSRWRLFTLIAIWVLLLIAASRPEWVGEPQALAINGRDLLLAVDISESMSEKDMQQNNRYITRITAVKNVVSEFIERRKGDRIGLVLFGSNAYLQTPLTFDTASVEQFLQEAQLGFAGPKTAIGDAIGLSVKRLQARSQSKALSSSQSPDNNQVIILLTDGANTAGEIEPLQAATLAEKMNTKIYTIGVGAEEMIVRGFFGNSRINPSAALDEETLTAIASTTGGLYFRAKNTQELSSIYQELDKLEPIEQEKEWLRPTRSLFMWPLSGALLLSLILCVLIQRQRFQHAIINLATRTYHRFNTTAPNTPKPKGARSKYHG